jgi:hypothetical protein
MTRLSLLFALDGVLLDPGRTARIWRAGCKIRDREVPALDPEHIAHPLQPVWLGGRRRFAFERICKG